MSSEQTVEEMSWEEFNKALANAFDSQDNSKQKTVYIPIPWWFMKRQLAVFANTVSRFVWRPVQSEMGLLCHVCAENNRSAFYQLIYSVRGEHVCKKCGRKFTVTFTPNNSIDENVQHLSL